MDDTDDTKLELAEDAEKPQEGPIQLCATPLLQAAMLISKSSPKFFLSKINMEKGPSQIESKIFALCLNLPQILVAHLKNSDADATNLIMHAFSFVTKHKEAIETIQETKDSKELQQIIKGLINEFVALLMAYIEKVNDFDLLVAKQVAKRLVLFNDIVEEYGGESLFNDEEEDSLEAKAICPV